MKKVFKCFLPLICIILPAAVAVWFQHTRPAENNDSSPEDALQAALGGMPDITEQAPDMDDTESSNAAVSRMPELSQEMDPEMSGAENVNVAADTTEIFLDRDLPLHDLYAVPGQAVRFQIFHPDTSNHTWEYYDMESRKWLLAEDAGRETDASGNVIAYADFITPIDQPELMIRCLYETTDTNERVSEIAFLKVLPQKISRLELAADIAVEAGDCLAAGDVMVEVTYVDDTSDTIQGLCGLYFLEPEVESESSEFVSEGGVLTERKVQTVLNHFRQYYLVPAGETNITLAYMPDAGSSQLQLAGTVNGTDNEPPEISMVDILEKEKIPDSEDEENLTILITAEDNVTPYPGLQYAVIQKDADTDVSDIDAEEIMEEDWFSGPKAVVTLQRDSTWFFCCRDQAGNISFYKYGDPPEDPVQLPEESEDLPETEMDTQAPVIRNIYVEAE